MRQHSEQLSIRTDAPIQLIDVTKRVATVIANADIGEGAAFISTRHTTTAIRINEPCELLEKDAVRFFENLVPRAGEYLHNRKHGTADANAHSHLLSFLLGASETVPISKGKMQLGTWQAIFFIELDGPRQERGLTVTVIGQ
ncbi:MAG: YjbQ family protein [Deltaproteobacteria bacterium]|nr:YjbQ family protein [Deltaproteobacteria bacterium]